MSVFTRFVGTFWGFYWGEQRLVYFWFCNMKIKSYIRELENGYASAPFCTYNTVLLYKLEQLPDTRYIQLKGNPDRFGYSQGFLKWEIEKETKLLFFNSTKLWILWRDFSFFWLINKLEQQLDLAIPAHFTSRSHPKRYFLHLLVFLGH